MEKEIIVAVIGAVGGVITAWILRSRESFQGQKVLVNWPSPVTDPTPTASLKENDKTRVMSAQSIRDCINNGLRRKGGLTSFAGNIGMTLLLGAASPILWCATLEIHRQGTPAFLLLLCLSAGATLFVLVRGYQMTTLANAVAHGLGDIMTKVDEEGGGDATRDTA
jgi:hypothetical protein